VRVVVGWKESDEAVRPGDLCARDVRLFAGDVVAPVRGTSRQIDEDSVEAVPALELDQRLGEHSAVEPDVGGRVIAVEKVMTEGELAHDRQAVGHLMPHGRGDSLPAGHHG
jgi:hypothetical protein